MNNRRARIRSTVLVSLLAACSGADLVLPTEGAPAAITIVQGNDQVGRAGDALAEPIVARVTDARGRPVIGAPVALSITSGEATVTPESADTDEDGDARFDLVLGTRVGNLLGSVAVLAENGEATVRADLRLVAVSADAAGISLAAGDGQTAAVGTPLPAPLVVQVADVFGNPIPGVLIRWSVEGGGEVSPEETETDAEGRAAAERTLGPLAGEQRARASADGLAGSPVTFTHIATSGSAARLEAVSGDGQSAVVGTSLPEDLVVRLLDPEGNPVSGTAVAWVVGVGAGSAAPSTISTDAEGRAATRWTLGGASGQQTITAVVSGVGVVVFTAVAIPGTPPGLRVVTQPSGAARRGTALAQQPVIQLVDPEGASLRQSGVPVTVAVAAGDGRLRGTLTRVTDSDGRAAFTDLALEGPAGAYTLAFGADGFTGAVSGAIQLARALTTTSILSDTPDPSAPGGAVRVAFQVGSDGGRPGGNVTVRADEGASCTAAVAAGSCAITLTRTGSQALVASYSGDAEFEPSSDTETHVVEAPATPALALATPPSATVIVGAPFERQPVIRLEDGRGNPVGRAGLTVTAAVSSGGGTLIGQATRTTDASGQAAFQGLGIGGAPGPHILTFTAEGFGAVSSGTIDVQTAGTTLRITSDAPDPSAPGQPIPVRYTVTSPAGTPPGDVTVSAGTASCTGTVAAGGCDLVLGLPGDYVITARYPGGPGFAPAEATESHAVRVPIPEGPSPSLSTVSVEPATVEVGQDARVRVTVRDAAGRALGGVEVTLDVTGSGNAVDPGTSRTGGNGQAEFRVRSTVAETKTIGVVAGGVPLDQRPTLTVTRAPTTTQIESDDPDPSNVGAPITIAVSVRSNRGVPTGTVTVSADGGLSCVVTLASSGGACALTPPAEGTLTLTASYAGDASFAPSGDSETHQVAVPAARVLVMREQPDGEARAGEPLRRQPEVQLALDNGEEVRTAGVSVQAQLSGGGTLQGTTSVQTDGNGRARFRDLAITGPEGSYTITFSAEGFLPVTSAPIDLRRGESRTEITGDAPDPSLIGEAFEVSFRVRGGGGVPSGSVLVAVEGGPSCTGTLSDAGEGSCALVLDLAGEVILTASYAGDDRFGPSTGQGTHRTEAPQSSASN